jgi:protein-S-isoprenylcysteine O-methyltransferase Ste14
MMMQDSNASLPETKAASGFLIRIETGAQGLLPILLWASILFASAGRLDWKRGWAAFAVYMLTILGIGVLARRFNPGLMSVRAKPKYKQTQSFDRLFYRIFLPLTYIQVAVAGLDAVRYRWLPLPLWCALPGVLLFVSAMGLIGWVMAMNHFAEATVRIQSERNHAVVSSGPYRIVRHPMYVGMILMYPATALMFGSGWAMAVAALILVLIVWRTALEDRFLFQNLQGYPEYAAHTRYRLIPGIW